MNQTATAVREDVGERESEQTLLQRFVSRRMSPQMASAWRRKYCNRQWSILWTRRRVITPELVPRVYGDGKQAIALRPIITRREHYVLAIDSSVQIYSGDFHDVLDTIYDDIEDIFGPCQCVECGEGFDVGNDPDGCKACDARFKQWPVACFNGGTEWWPL